MEQGRWPCILGDCYNAQTFSGITLVLKQGVQKFETMSTQKWSSEKFTPLFSPSFPSRSTMRKGIEKRISEVVLRREGWLESVEGRTGCGSLNQNFWLVIFKLRKILWKQALGLGFYGSYTLIHPASVLVKVENFTANLILSVCKL